MSDFHLITDMSDRTFQLSSRLFQITIADDVVALKHRAGFVTGDGHCHPLWYASANKIPDSSSAEVMKKLSY
jgi:hypothetical protein